MTNEQTRERIKKHLINRGHESNFVVTEPIVRYWWRQLNESVFSGILSPPAKIVIQKFIKNNTIAYCTPFNKHHARYVVATNCVGTQRTVKFIISKTHPYRPMTRELLISMIVHEMVHQWEWEILGVWKGPLHGKRFMSWAPDIKQAIGVILGRSV